VVVEVPATGIGLAGTSPLASLFAAAAMAAAAGAVGFRNRGLSLGAISASTER
jgi:hypothetical protein